MVHTSLPSVAILPATVAHLRALEHDRTALAGMLGSPVPDGWPTFPESIPYTRAQLEEHPEQAGWWMHFFLEPGTGTLLGAGGYAGPPRERTVELGYEIAPAFRGRRFGTGAAAALVERAAASGEVDVVVACTLPHENPSTRVLTALGFARDGESVDPDEGAVRRWRLPVA